MDECWEVGERRRTVAKGKGGLICLTDRKSADQLEQLESQGDGARSEFLAVGPMPWAR